MKKEYIIDALNLLNPDIINETDVIRNSKKHTRKRTWKWAAAITATGLAAACLAFTIYTGKHSTLPKSSDTTQQHTAKLPMLTIAENTNDDMGFEGYMAYDISELVNNNPWNETEQPSTLPVYQNQLSYDENYLVANADYGKMKKILIEIASRMGLDADSLQITDNAPDEETRQIITEKLDGDVPEGYFNPTELIIQADGMEITVDQQLDVMVSFEPAIALPEQYNFTDSASYEETFAVAKYLQNKYANLIHMEHPQINIYDGDYDINLQQQYQISFFDAGKDATKQIINYNFHQANFYCDDNGKLYLVRISQPDLSQKTGDYPIITAEEAKALLLKENYITTVPYALPGENYIAKTELVYRTGTREQYFMPYYRFYAELPEEERDGLKTYGTYYVPAVKESYISNMPLWDGSFN